MEELDWSGLQKELKKGGNLVVDFWAPWCGPCQRLGPVYAEVAKKLKSKAAFVKVNVEDNPDAASLGISSIPCIVVFKDGEEADRMVGALPEDELEAKIVEMLS